MENWNEMKWRKDGQVSKKTERRTERKKETEKTGPQLKTQPKNDSWYRRDKERNQKLTNNCCYLNTETYMITSN